MKNIQTIIMEKPDDLKADLAKMEEAYLEQNVDEELIMLIKRDLMRVFDKHELHDLQFHLIWNGDKNTLFLKGKRVIDCLTLRSIFY